MEIEPGYGLEETLPAGWLHNYSKHPWTVVAPLAAFGATLLALVVSARGRAALALILSCVGVAAVVLTAAFALFPFIMPSSSDPKSSLTALLQDMLSKGYLQRNPDSGIFTIGVQVLWLANSYLRNLNLINPTGFLACRSDSSAACASCYT